MKDSIAIKGIIRAVLTDTLTGQVKLDQTDYNIVPNAGRQAIIDRLQGNTPAVPDYIAIGTSSTAAAASQTALVAEVARAQGTLSQPDAHTDRCTYTFPAGTGTGTITEVARLNASSAGTMFGRGILGTAAVKTAADSLQITYDFTYAAS